MQKRSFCVLLALLLVWQIASALTAGAGLVTTVTLSGVHSAQLCRFALYSYTDGKPAGEDLLSGVRPEGEEGAMQQYVVLLPSGGEYWVEGYDENGDCSGGMTLSVLDKGNTEYKIQRVYALHASNSGWQSGVDYTTDLTITSPLGETRDYRMGTADNYGTRYDSCIFAVGDTVTATFTPAGERAADYLPATVEKKPMLNCELQSQIYRAAELSFTAPAGSVISVGRLTDYYVYDFFDAVREETTADGGVCAVFRVPQQKPSTSGVSFFCRVQHPQGVTYWDFFDPTKAGDPAVEVTAAQLYIGDSTHTAQTTVTDFRYNTYDKADLLLNANAAGCVSVQPGQSFSLSVFRSWMAIESVYNTKVALPDVHYRVIGMDGAESDLLEVTSDAYNSGLASVRANGSGDAVLLITYDAMFSTQAYVNGAANQPCFFSALWPENTGVLVVHCGKDISGIDTGMTLGGDGAEYALDAELDPLFYVEENGAEYTFTPPAGSAVSVDRCRVTDSMTFTGFTQDGVRANADGSVTVGGLTTGRHIVKVSTAQGDAYQVVSARQISYARQEEGSLRAGDTAQYQFSGLVNPVEKMSGIYNHSPRIRYIGADGSVFLSPVGGAFGVYDFSGNPERQTLDVHIPKYWTGDVYTLSAGCIAEQTLGSAPGGHRAVSFNIGVDHGFSATGKGVLQGALPDLEIPLEKTDFLTGRLSLTLPDGSAVDLSQVRITLTDADGEAARVAPDGTFPCFAGTYAYSIEGEGFEPADGEVTVGKDGDSFDVTLTKTSVPDDPDSPDKPLTLWQRIARFFIRVWRWLKAQAQRVRTYFEKIGKKS